jgi:hypothetical protein
MQHPESSRSRRSTDRAAPSTLHNVAVTTVHHLRAGLRRPQLLGRARWLVETQAMLTKIALGVFTSSRRQRHDGHRGTASPSPCGSTPTDHRGHDSEGPADGVWANRTPEPPASYQGECK